MKTSKTDYRKHYNPKTGRWSIDAMSDADLDALAKECEKIKPGEGRPLTAKERREFEAWQKKALAEEKETQKARQLTLVFPPKLSAQIDELAKSRHTTPANLLKRLVQEAIHQAVA